MKREYVRFSPGAMRVLPFSTCWVTFLVELLVLPLLLFTCHAFALPPNHHRPRPNSWRLRASSTTSQEITSSSSSSPVVQELSTIDGATISRRKALVGAGGLVALASNALLPSPQSAWAVDDDATSAITSLPPLELRDRKNNKDALIREDYWYQTGRLPPRLLTTAIRSADDVQWNAFGSCTSADGGNPCTYVSLKQRAPAYAKYAFTLQEGAREFTQLGAMLQQSSSNNMDWAAAARLVSKDYGAATVDAELKMILLATALLVSPNFPTPNKELLVARFYANEIHYAHDTLRRALLAQNLPLARQAWDFGKDAWNSYFVIVNRSISPKVGEQFAFVE